MMTTAETIVEIQGRLFLKFTIRAATGMHIGGSPGALSIGNVDNPVIRDAVTQRPYIPGSSLRGKMRSLMEKEHALPQNTSIGHQVKMHICKDAQEYAQCPVCKTFGIPGEYEHSETSRLIVRDALMTDASADELDKARTDLPYTEVKWEAAIDRVTSAATPRQQERVPAGALFHGELVFSLYNHEQHADNLYELDLFAHVLQALALVELDYLGGQGSRGSGKIEFLVHELRLRQNSRYTEQPLVIPAKKDDDAKKSVPLSLQELRDEWTNLRTRM